MNIVETILRPDGSLSREIVALPDGRFAVRNGEGARRYTCDTIELARQCLSFLVLKDRPRGPRGLTGRLLGTKIH